MMRYVLFYFFFFKQKTAYEMRISDWSSDVCSSDLGFPRRSLAPSFAGQALRFRQQALERDILETESAQMMNRVLEVLEARAAVAAALEDQSHHRIVVESTGVLAMTAVDHEGHGPDEALAGFRAAPARPIDARDRQTGV